MSTVVHHLSFMFDTVTFRFNIVTNNIVYTQVNGDRDDVPNALVIILDGRPNVDEALTTIYAQALKTSGVKVHSSPFLFDLQTNGEYSVAI